VRSALTLLESSPVGVAVLDHVIMGGHSRPIADLLVQRGVAFLFHTSHRGDLPERYPSVTIIDKPSRPEELVRSLKAFVAKRS